MLILLLLMNNQNKSEFLCLHVLVSMGETSIDTKVFNTIGRLGFVGDSNKIW